MCQAIKRSPDARSCFPLRDEDLKVWEHFDLRRQPGPLIVCRSISPSFSTAETVSHLNFCLCGSVGTASSAEANPGQVLELDVVPYEDSGSYVRST